jgi:catechol 2,3-dioxygenase-like lactoylglutathione lyase family enzyme
MTASALKLNHVDLVVTDIVANRQFLERWFGMISEKEDEGICLLRDGDGLLLILRRAEPGQVASYPRDFHLGFFVPDEETVIQLYEGMRDDGVAFTQTVEDPPVKFRCLTTAGLLIEVAHVPGS